ncbi:MAG: acetyl-CoA acetyltransferase [Candidatus Limnocylindria bacterium]|jgi:acetyl-CoA C-acetyltransferase
MALDPRTPLLVGVGAVSQREADPARAEEPLALMHRALERAAEDAGCPALLARADSIRAPRGFWSYPDPCRMLAERFGAAGARTEIAEIGVLQTALLGRVAADVAAGRAEVVLVVGAEARHRSQRAGAAGIEAPLTRQAPVTPDSVLRPQGPILSAREIRAGLALPVVQYALLENALRAAEGLSLDAHRRAIAALQAALSETAAGNPEAWSREPVSADAIADPGRNPMLAFPYGKLHCSNWNVDQAAGLAFCSVATARALGIARERWIFPLAVADANHMVPYTERRMLHRCAGFARAAERAFERAGRDLAGVAHRELYSCFPSAVRVQVREFGIADERPLSLSGGMAFAGGPLNHFVLQSLVPMARRLRAAPGSVGLLTAVSGVLAKQGVSLWSGEPGAAPFAHDDVSEATARDTAVADFAEAPEGAARVATYTVVYENERPKRLVLIADLEDGARAIASSDDLSLVEAATREELCGRAVRLAAGGGLGRI